MSRALDRLLQQVAKLEQARNLEKDAHQALNDAMHKLQAALERLRRAQDNGPRVIH